MKKALIGFSGFVGTTLLKQVHFDALYRSSNIQEICGNEFDVVVCAGVPAQKWIANKNPKEDLENISKLISHLEKIKCNTFILISTVDVFKSPVDVDESTPVDEDNLHAYGLHRRILEKFVEQRFSRHLVVRLPGLVGPGLRKNVIYDFAHHNNIEMIDSRGIFQFYPMVNLWPDIQTALNANLSLVHLTAEPIAVHDIAEQGFGRSFDQKTVAIPAIYNMRTQYASVFGASGDYQYSQRETVLATRSYAQSEGKHLTAAEVMP